MAAVVASTLPLIVTPAIVPPTLLKMSCDPPLVLTAPPLIVPPSSVHDPLAASRFNPPLSVPVRFTVPPVRTKLPSVARVKLPARFSVELVETIVPALLQPEPRDNVEPLTRMVLPALLIKSTPVIVPPLMAWIEP